MRELFVLLKKGNKPALWASIINATIAVIKGIAYFITGNVAMFAEMMHSIGDMANQFFVFIGSALSKKAPTDKFPNGFARLVNLVLLGAVIIVGILAYETIKEGIHHILHPPEAGSWLWLNLTVLGVAAILESFVLYKAMKEVVKDIGEADVKGMEVVKVSLANLGRAKPATKLVFLEDMVATSGALIAMISILIATYTPFHTAEGYASVIIGVMLFYVVGRIFLDNAAGVLGVADEEMEEKIGEFVFEHPEVRDIKKLMVMKEGEELHVELKLEFDPEMSIEKIDQVLGGLEKKILNQRGVKEVIIESDEDDHQLSWDPDKNEV
ncbi:cation diffusion facilitator family transporter [Halobacillus litoralis]|uniref:Cation diffusion facilitator family transporter n=1 Tax=Halobacillus litoralis TaxID=45668 RepID=A0A845F943_9BACI|nr:MULTISPECIES: cation diffusion facilitator family transporter [Halobacillus]MEC3885631.1 cation diffusion facilitator family transporter [Halobacillus sp. HZG1]MYL70371.1 cation diffusion facilitator family transporter [Halobacillus litoralis]